MLNRRVKNDIPEHICSDSRSYMAFSYAITYHFAFSSLILPPNPTFLFYFVYSQSCYPGCQERKFLSYSGSYLAVSPGDALMRA